MRDRLVLNIVVATLLIVAMIRVALHDWAMVAILSEAAFVIWLLSRRDTA